MYFKKFVSFMLIILVLPIIGFKSINPPKNSRIIIKLTDEKYENALKSSFGKRLFKITDFYYAVTVDSSVNLINKFMKSGVIRYIGVDYPLKALSVKSVPDDPEIKKQYYLRNSGEALEVGDKFYETKKGADVRAIKAWKYIDENQLEEHEIIVAVLDTGVNYKNPDLENKIVDGYDFVNDDDDPFDDNGHGTAVSGIIAGELSNSVGIAGICRKCKILPVKVLDENGEGNQSVVSAGIFYAINHGARIINISAGYSESSPILELAVKSAYENGIVIVAPTGDDGEEKILYPSAYNKWVLSVGATNPLDKVTIFSNYGNGIDVVAPGRFLYTTRGKGFGFLTGTSGASAVVSGVCGVILSLKPFLTPDEVYTVVKLTSDDVNKDKYPGYDIYAGFGRVNLYKAISPIVVEGN